MFGAVVYGVRQGRVVALAVVCGSFRRVMEGQFWRGGVLIFSGVCNY